ncbi:MFS general substrate transporter, partial [Mycena metata]
GSTGPLIPRIQRVYHVNFDIVSLIFVFACVVRFIGGAMINVPLTDRLGFGKMIFLGSLCQIAAYVMLAPASPFPVFVLSFVINGVGVAIQDAQANGYIASLRRNSETKMGLLHGVYGAGALVAPIVATQFAQMNRWSFKRMVLDMAMHPLDVFVSFVRVSSRFVELLVSIGDSAGETSTSEHSTFRQILSTKTVHLLAFFILIYVGIEVTIGGWIVTYIIDVRGGGPSSGYVSAGFFGGTVYLSIHANTDWRIGENCVLFLYSVLAIGVEVVVWKVPSLIGDTVAVSIVGVLLGPIYPIVMNVAGRVLPDHILRSKFENQNRVRRALVVCESQEGRLPRTDPSDTISES